MIFFLKLKFEKLPTAETSSEKNYQDLKINYRFKIIKYHDSEKPIGSLVEDLVGFCRNPKEEDLCWGCIVLASTFEVKTTKISLIDQKLIRKHFVNKTNIRKRTKQLS